VDGAGAAHRAVEDPGVAVAVAAGAGGEQVGGPVVGQVHHRARDVGDRVVVAAAGGQRGVDVAHIGGGAHQIEALDHPDVAGGAGAAQRAADVRVFAAVAGDVAAHRERGVVADARAGP
ncbi:MAG: hypothetical protein ACK559_08140, partial [bacterium]